MRMEQSTALEQMELFLILFLKKIKQKITEISMQKMI